MYLQYGVLYLILTRPKFAVCSVMSRVFGSAIHIQKTPPFLGPKRCNGFWKFKSLEYPLKVPKCEIFNRSDFHYFTPFFNLIYFYTIKPFWVDDFGAKI
jgi:hypothetical protein